MTRLTRSSTPLSGNPAESGSGIAAFPFDTGLGVGGAFFADLDKYGAEEAQTGTLAGNREGEPRRSGVRS